MMAMFERVIQCWMWTDILNDFEESDTLQVSEQFLISVISMMLLAIMEIH